MLQKCLLLCKLMFNNFTFTGSAVLNPLISAQGLVREIFLNREALLIPAQLWK